jgi:peptidoglycan/xylan/chitin deacetylase (PgdA/CDA1 family)
VTKPVLALAVVLLALGCKPKAADVAPSGSADTDTDTDTDTDADADSDSDTDADTDTDSDTDTDTDPSQRRWDCSGIDPADRGPLGGYVTLTFDDGPSSVHTPAILDVLRRYDVPATFFMLGERVADPDTWPIVEEIVDDPLFGMANHSWSHPELTSLSTPAMESEIDDTTDLLETFGPIDFFRFPYGSSDCDAVDRVTSRGMRVAGWHIDTADWCYAAVGTTGTCEPEDYWRVPEEYADDMRGYIVEQVGRFDGGVVLFHDIHAYTADTVEDVILDLRAGGFTFVALDDATAWPNLNAGTPVDLPFLGEPCDVVDDLCWQVEYFAWCEPVNPDDPGDTRGVCTMECEGYCGDRDGAATTFCAEQSTGAGQCIGRSDVLNDWCADVPGSVETALDRHVGASGASPATADVCAPQSW